ncbi:hypothetical protein BDB00DRAFT_879290 [Zychaea mexicana]|uniref:uncharacterized protein n=1 Tax=Zychaea mexicana TaxID=64656 RepID=UPI0022FE8737|nr:uncharacterized protein BDB00DRAFT_879290 [Zychaea mexicana]KAI9479569.1 hypothetical protein BDB00DRAFT_879290 [Zychaea mexicana]
MYCVGLYLVRVISYDALQEDYSLGLSKMIEEAPIFESQICDEQKWHSKPQKDKSRKLDSGMLMLPGKGGTTGCIQQNSDWLYWQNHKWMKELLNTCTSTPSNQGIQNPTISVATNKHQLYHWGFRGSPQKKDVYTDGHEREDMMQDWIEWAALMVKAHPLWSVVSSLFAMVALVLPDGVLLVVLADAQGLLIPIAFASCRTPNLKSIKTLRNILKTCDSLALDINFKTITTDAVADLPLQLVFPNNPTSHPVTNCRYNWTGLQVKHSFTLDPHTGLLRRTKHSPREQHLNSDAHNVASGATYDPRNHVHPTLLTGIAIDELTNQLYRQTISRLC